jgi:hypothetical protein
MPLHEAAEGYNNATRGTSKRTAPPHSFLLR